MLASQHFAGLSTLKSEINPEIYRYLKDYFTEQSGKCRKIRSVKYRTAHEMRTMSRDFNKFTG